MDVLVLRVSLANNTYRTTANALLSCRAGRRLGVQHMAFRMTSCQGLMQVASRLGAFRNCNQLACSTFRSPCNVLPIFRSALQPSVDNSPVTFVAHIHNAGHSYSARPLRDERLKKDQQENATITTEGQSIKSDSCTTGGLGGADSSTKDIQAAVPFTEHSDAKNLGTVANCDYKVEKPSTNSEGQLPVKEESHSGYTRMQKSSSDAVEVKQPGIFKRFQLMYKQYGVVLVGVHVFTSSIWAGIFYYAAVSGVNVVPILQWMGASDMVISPFLLPGVGNAAVTYLMYKLATPARYTVTIAGTQLAVRYLRRYGYLKQPETADGKPDSLKSLVKDSREKVKDKMGDIREDMHELKDELKEKIGHIRENHHHKSPGGSSQQPKP